MKALAIAGGVVLFVVLCVGAWFGYWALARANTEQQYGVNTGTQQYQSSVISQERDYVHDYDASDNDAQKNQIALTFCDRYSELTKVPDDLAAAHSRLCN